MVLLFQNLNLKDRDTNTDGQSDKLIDKLHMLSSDFLNYSSINMQFVSSVNTTVHHASSKTVSEQCKILLLFQQLFEC